MGGGCCCIGSGSGTGWWTYIWGSVCCRWCCAEEVGELREQREELLAERDKLQAANTIESKQNIDRSMQKELTDQIQTLTAENQKLKDDLAFFEGWHKPALG
jgi:hypothetical protein